MSIKRFLSVMVCFMILLPSFAKAISANEVSALCVNSGIAGYYASVSKAAFDMVNVLFQDFLDAAKQSSKKEVPAKPENESNKNDKAIIPDNSKQKTFKTNFTPFTPVYIDSAKDIYVSKMTGDSNAFSLGWMLLLLTMLILSIKKKDGSEISFNNYSVNKHPVLL